MKKFLFVLTAMVILFSLTACNTVMSTTKPNTNLISQTQITDREKMFLSIGNDEHFIFDFNVDTKYKWLEVWVDRYEFGEKVLGTGKLSTGLSQGKEGMIIATVNEFEKMKQNFTLVINNGGATSKIETNQEYKVVENCSFSKMWGTNTSETISINDMEITLASICYQDQSKSNSMSSLTDEFFSNPEENTKQIENYSLVYLLKCKFYENSPN